MSLVAASRVKLTDSLSQTKGNFELQLINGKLITWENATCFNNPAGLDGAIGFQIKLTKSTNSSNIKSADIENKSIRNIRDRICSEQTETTAENSGLFNK